MSVVIQVDRLSKQYRFGTVGGKRLVDDVNRWWARLRGKEDPLAKIGSEVNGHKQADSHANPPASGLRPPASDSFWALKDVSFEVKQGEVLGIIGRNGAGKSTLLKILSRVTAPTAGEVRVKGRIASLLEVGTGFNPELTGRENIFLNGAVLGMTKAEIRSRFDEIVSFSEVEQFIDTPVKRYSSGMTVRLAFAVAAHLEPEILIVDEVLAVGDIEFQKKCLGKMKAVAGQGRTVLFVSHNMAAVLGLCPKGALLVAGRLEMLGESSAVVDSYLKHNAGAVEGNGGLALAANRSGDGRLRLTSFHVESTDGTRLTTILNGMDVVMALGFECRADCASAAMDVGISFASDQGSLLTVFYSSYVNQLFRNLSTGGQFRCVIRRFALAPGTYTVGAKITASGRDVDYPRDPIGQITVEAGNFYGTGSRGFEGRSGFLIEGEWSVAPAGN